MQSTSLLTLTVVAAAAVTAERFGTVTGAVATAAGNAGGVFRSSGETGDHVPLDALGTAVVTAGAAITAGDAVEVGTAGKAVTATSGVPVGRALSAATADGDRIEIMLLPN